MAKNGDATQIFPIFFGLSQRKSRTRSNVANRYAHQQRESAV